MKIRECVLVLLGFHVICFLPPMNDICRYLCSFYQVKNKTVWNLSRFFFHTTRSYNYVDKQVYGSPDGKQLQ